MSEIETSLGSILVRNGHWAIPPEKRPNGWERLNLPEPDEFPDVAMTDHAATDPPPETTQPSTDIRYPIPPMEFAAVFQPIFAGISAGLKARKTLMDLTSYCLELEIALQEADIRRANIATPDGEQIRRKA